MAPSSLELVSLKALGREKNRDQVPPSMTSISSLPNNHAVSTAILFFKIILGKTLEDGKLKIPNNFTRKYGGFLSNQVFLNPPDGTEWKVYCTKHDDDGEILLEKGWKEFATYYSLDHGHLLLFEYKGNSHFVVNIFDMSGLEIEYPFHDQINDVAAEILVQSKNTKLKSPMFSPQPCKKLRTCTNIGDVRTSHNLENLLPQMDQINGNLSQGAIFEKSTFVSVKKELDEEIGGNGITPCQNVELSTKVTESLNKATASSRSRENPSFMVIMKPSYASKYTMNVPSWFEAKYLKKMQGTSLFQVLDGRTWSVVYSLGKFNSGWNRFASDNNLNVGDICVFELTNPKGLSFKVSISREAQEPSFPLGRKETQRTSQEPSSPQPQGRKEIQRTSRESSPHSNTNVALEKAEKFTSENPFFMVRIKQSLLGPGRPHVSSAFVKEHLNNAKQIVTLKCRNKSWRVKLLRNAYSTPRKLSTGWLLFVKESELQAGDVCIFELINREDAVFDVHIFRRHC